MKTFLTAIPASLLLLAGGCSSPKVEVRVDAINSPTPQVSRDYTLAARVGSNELINQEVAALLRTELSARGFAENGTGKGELTITYDYGLGAPRTVARRTSEPVYGWDFDNSDVIVTQTPAPGGGFVTTTQRVTRPPSMRVMGYNEGSVPVSVFDKFLTLNAIGPKGPAWTVTAQTTGESDDLRRAIPFLSKAAAAKAGSNTGGQIVISYELEEKK